MNAQINTIQKQHPKSCEYASLVNKCCSSIKLIDSINGEYVLTDAGMDHYAKLEYVKAESYQVGCWSESDIIIICLDMIHPDSEEEMKAITEDADLVLHAMFTNKGSYAKYIH